MKTQNTQKPRHKVGSRIQLTANALENYGQKYSGKKFTVTHVATKYMPASQFFDNGSPAGFHPGYDESDGCALYDCAGLNFSLYEWEIV